MLSRTPSDHPTDLTDELIQARQKYQSVKNSVIDRAVKRQYAARETIKDLQTEVGALEAVVQSARQ